MRLRLAPLLLLLCGVCTHAAVDPFAHPATGEALLRSTLARPAVQLAKAQVLKGRFTHSKHLSEIPQPLVASGEFIFARDLGVYWHTQQPFDSVVVLTNSGIVQRDEGAQTLQLSADEQPAVRVIANIFLALFTLDVTSLSRNFDLYGLSQGERWIIGLKPRSSAIASVFRQATVTGSGDVEQVVLTDAHGDRTVIDLSAIEYSEAAAGADVRALFAPAKP
ncbi:MAG TPA: outer membrane lipoprotein carrier protein LolA [Povalibacter sp.]|uniref:outer membrane lipoprotein carrier protein LolA n=1 Tax=Povalibacter sp. TaxID=1962978 RepID=UPI002C42D986|nr:outer membrane lipoprotein carrier protein LolA [Povalibacter sp.]HMN44778.1 outer membrane lipoprotein carrier protein LolA [Povalibacter sp.]